MNNIEKIPHLAVTSTGLTGGEINSTFIAIISETISRVVLDIIAALALIIKDLQQQKIRNAAPNTITPQPELVTIKELLPKSIKETLSLSQTHLTEDFFSERTYSTARDIDGGLTYSINGNPLDKNKSISGLDDEIITACTFSNVIYNTVLSSLMLDHKLSKDEAWKFDLSCQQGLILTVNDLLREKIGGGQYLTSMTDFDKHVNVDTTNKTVTLSIDTGTVKLTSTNTREQYNFKFKCSAIVDHEKSTLEIAITCDKESLQPIACL